MNEDPRLSEATPDELRERIAQIEAEGLAAAQAEAVREEVGRINRLGDAVEAEVKRSTIKVATEHYDCPACEAKAGTPCGDKDRDTHVFRINLARKDGELILAKVKERRPDLLAAIERVKNRELGR